MLAWCGAYDDCDYNVAASGRDARVAAMPNGRRMIRRRRYELTCVRPPDRGAASHPLRPRHSDPSNPWLEPAPRARPLSLRNPVLCANAPIRYRSAGGREGLRYRTRPLRAATATVAVPCIDFHGFLVNARGTRQPSRTAPVFRPRRADLRQSATPWAARTLGEPCASRGGSKGVDDVAYQAADAGSNLAFLFARSR